MAVRKTESRIPGGFDKAGELGEAVASADGNYVLVSYLTAPLRADPELLKLRNRYVVFVNTENVGAPSDYEWVFQFFGDDPINPVHVTPARLTDYGICTLDVEDIPEVLNAAITRVIVTVIINGVVGPLEMNQPVSGLFADIEELIVSDAEGSIALGGNPPITRAIANRYRVYIEASDSDDDSIGVPKNLVTAIAYLTKLSVTDDVLDVQTEAWENYIDGAGDETTVPIVALGVTQFHPYIVSMFVGGDGNTPGMTATDTWATETETYSVFQSRVSLAFHTVVPFEQPPIASTQRADYINLLRFPKSALRVTRIMLDTRLAQHQAWKDLPRVDLVKNRTAIEVLSSECEVGPFEGEPQLTPVGKNVFNKMFTPFIQAIVASNYAKFFLLGTSADEVVDIDTTTLNLHLVRTLEEVVVVGGGDFEVLISVYIKQIAGGPNSYEIFELIGQVKTVSGVRKLTFISPAPIANQIRPPLAQEPGWPAAPLFGRKAKLSVLDTNGYPIEGGEDIELWIPTLRYGEMWNSNGKSAVELAVAAPDEELLLLQFGCYINGVLDKPPVQTKIRWETMKQAVIRRITDAKNSDSDYNSLTYTIDPSLIKNTTVGLMLSKNHHLESIVLHSVSTWGDHDAGAREAHTNTAAHNAKDAAAHLSLAKNHAYIERLFNVDRCIDIWNHYRPWAYPHYILGRGGELIELRSPRRMTAHAQAHGSAITYGNLRSVGIEIVGIDDSRRSQMVDAYQQNSTANAADNAEVAANKVAWTTAWKAFVVANGGEAITASNPFDAENSFFDFTKQQYKALQILIETLGERYGYIRICSHNWLDQRGPVASRRRTDPGEKFDFSKIAGALASGGPVQIDSAHKENGFIYMIAGKENGDSRM